MDRKRQIQAERIYLLLGGIFIASLVGSNLIFQKFFIWELIIPFLGSYTFQLSVGILPYPITFLVTDIISEIYGIRKANQIVFVGFISSIFIMSIVSLADYLPATVWSPVGDETFHTVFGLFGPAIIASMSAYITAQFVDIRVFHFWKKLTNNKHLWLRNNGSTIFSQLVDTSSVLFLLCSFGVIEWEMFGGLFINGFIFKVLIAFIDTPFFYFFSGLLRKHFNLQLGEELK